MADRECKRNTYIFTTIIFFFPTIHFNRFDYPDKTKFSKGYAQIRD